MYMQKDLKQANAYFKGTKLYSYQMIETIILHLREEGFFVLESLSGHEGDSNIMAANNVLSKFSMFLLFFPS